jgi:hypothetical protein
MMALNLVNQFVRVAHIILPEHLLKANFIEPLVKEVLVLVKDMLLNKISSLEALITYVTLID